MSEIAGIINYNQQPINIDHCNMMINHFNHPSADKTSVWYDDTICLGCSARWITPESVNEILPFYDSERQIAITADAILDNRQELFDHLQIKKINRKTITDSQLILLAYCKWGDSTPNYLIGDFAFIIWDERQQKIFGARDFSGMRTLYYYNDTEHFAFCTTIKPLLQLPYVKNTLNETWLAEYLAIPEIIDVVDPNLTVIESIKQIPPSHSITVTRDHTTVKRYYPLQHDKQIRFKKDEEYVEAFQEVFQKAVDVRLRSIGPVGSQLSGGLDSGSVVGFASKTLRQQNREFNTYSYIPDEQFEDWTPAHMLANESEYIKSTVDYIGGIKANYYSFDGKNPLSEIDDWLDIMEMPYKFFENSFWVKGIHEQAANDGVKVLLNGARGNFTISGGKALDYYSKLMRQFKWLKLFKEVKLYSSHQSVSQKRVLSVLSKRAFPFLGPTKGPYIFPQLINDTFAAKTNAFERISDLNSEGLSATEIREKHFRQAYIWNVTGTSASKMSLHYGMWDRDPTSDLRVIQFCLSLPDDQFVSDGLDRALIRKGTKGYLPDKVRLNQKVRGIQAADWLYRMKPVWSIYLEELKQLVNDPICSAYLNIDILNEILIKMETGPQVEKAFDPEYRVMMRALIVYRFLKRMLTKGGDKNETRMESTTIGSA
ncbi:asparagine synthetase B [Gracilibacillus oryzae]|uniref:asparagine synthase (glutamine-hydrolyzing) n=1 Tax=Gracilibacillus oryzae TaxID=1672701 RepID=A0A7C8GTM9_9BACI|nr:asparagine synthase-related protein [Gracilibacillus oryzae]KAB8133661.1 asparagine synthetase B [Gracilibacillus oryzae]